jgi:predicted dithiol-disulfide oxidoreductase (DUF899 family)
MLQEQLATGHVVTPDEWTQARKQLLVKEKEFTQAREALSVERRKLPWMKMDDYVFEGSEGKVPFAELFKGLNQLIVYHFMFAPGETDPCQSCSFWADNFNGIDIHLAHRDTSLVAVSRAPYAELASYRKRMGWTFDWFSSFGSEFNYDLGVSFQETLGKVTYNFKEEDFAMEDLPGISVFARGADGSIYRTYSAYSRGIDMMNGAYQYLDLTPKGRHEEGLPYSMAWVRPHDRY